MFVGSPQCLGISPEKLKWESCRSQRRRHFRCLDSRRPKDALDDWLALRHSISIFLCWSKETQWWACVGVMWMRTCRSACMRTGLQVMLGWPWCKNGVTLLVPVPLSGTRKDPMDEEECPRRHLDKPAGRFQKHWVSSLPGHVPRRPRMDTDQEEVHAFQCKGNLTSTRYTRGLA